MKSIVHVYCTVCTYTFTKITKRHHFGYVSTYTWVLWIRISDEGIFFFVIVWHKSAQCILFCISRTDSIAKTKSTSMKILCPMKLTVNTSVGSLSSGSCLMHILSYIMSTYLLLRHGGRVTIYYIKGNNIL